jgi:hypothetical protein
MCGGFGSMGFEGAPVRMLVEEWPFFICLDDSFAKTPLPTTVSCLAERDEVRAVSLEAFASSLDLVIRLLVFVSCITAAVAGGPMQHFVRYSGDISATLEASTFLALLRSVRPISARRNVPATRMQIISGFSMSSRKQAERASNSFQIDQVIDINVVEYKENGENEMR